MARSWMSRQVASGCRLRSGLAPAATASVSSTTRRPCRGQAGSAWCQLWLPSPPATTATKGLLRLSSARYSCPRLSLARLPHLWQTELTMPGAVMRAAVRSAPAISTAFHPYSGEKASGRPPNAPPGEDGPPPPLPLHQPVLRQVAVHRVSWRPFVCEEQPDALCPQQALVAPPRRAFVRGGRMLAGHDGEAVVGAVVHHPSLDVTLHRHAARYGQYHLQREPGLESAVGPVAVITQRDAEHREQVQCCCQHPQADSGGGGEDTVQCPDRETRQQYSQGHDAGPSRLAPLPVTVDVEAQRQDRRPVALAFHSCRHGYQLLSGHPRLAVTGVFRSAAQPAAVTRARGAGLRCPRTYLQQTPHSSHPVRAEGPPQPQPPSFPSELRLFRAGSASARMNS